MYDVFDTQGFLILIPDQHHLTSSFTAMGSRALLILQPRTGVAGRSEWAMLSSLLNMSDSVPPDQTRFPTISHLLRLELRGRENRERKIKGQRNWEDTEEYLYEMLLTSSGCQSSVY